MKDIATLGKANIIRRINDIRYSPALLTRRCCDIYDGLASHFYGNHVHANSADRQALVEALPLTRWA
jgi:hypothetical protein